MIDFARITIKAGDGGQGSGSFMRIRGRRYPKSDGGDGGGGGSVYFEATSDLNTLEPFRFIKKYQAENGQRGLSKKRKGADGGDLVIKVPAGTVIEVKDLGPAVLHPAPTLRQAQGKLEVYPESIRGTAGARVGTPRTSPKSGIIFELMVAGQKVLIARGGQGGRGNIHIKDESGRRPRSGEEGSAGEILNLTLELKLIADVGLIGLPNAGKSTLLSALTSAKPKIAAYPFTTLEPNLGTLSVPGIQVTRLSGRQETARKPDSLIARQPRQLVLADIPGLIEGASQGRGLGDLFLRHIERTRILVHLIDISQEADVWQAYRTIRTELRNYSQELAKKKEIIALNKVDLVEESRVENAVDLFTQHRKKVMFISAKEGLNLERLTAEIVKKI